MALDVLAGKVAFLMFIAIGLAITIAAGCLAVWVIRATWRDLKGKE